MEKLTKALRDLAEQMRADLVVRYAEHHIGCLGLLESLLAEFGEKSPRGLFRHGREAAKRGAALRDYNSYLEVIDRVHHTGKRTAGADAELQVRAEKEVADILQNWIWKVEGKLKPILSGKTFGVTGRAYAGSGAVECSLGFVLDNGTFEVRTQVVWAVSCNGTHFTRYPLTFHDAVVDGKKVTCDQGSVIEAFGGKFIDERGVKVQFYYQLKDTYLVTGWAKPHGEIKITRCANQHTGRTRIIESLLPLFKAIVAEKAAVNDLTLDVSEEILAKAQAEADEVKAQAEAVKVAVEAAEKAKADAKAAAKAEKGRLKDERAKKSGRVRKTQLQKVLAMIAEVACKATEEPARTLSGGTVYVIKFANGNKLRCSFSTADGKFQASFWEFANGGGSPGYFKITELMNCLKGE